MTKIQAQREVQTKSNVQIYASLLQHTGEDGSFPLTFVANMLRNKNLLLPREFFTQTIQYFLQIKQTTSAARVLETLCIQYLLSDQRWV